MKTIRLPRLTVSTSTIVASIAVCAIFTGIAYAAVNVFHDSQAEAGTRSGNVAMISDTSAAGGSAVKFGTAASGCPVATQHVFDGPDGMGGCWPGPLTTGVPTGTTLTAYTGPDTITTANTVIDGKLVQTSGLLINAPGVIIRNSRVETNITLGDNGSATINDSYVASSPSWTGATILGDEEDDPSGTNTLTLNRNNIDLGWASVICVNCTMDSNYMHGQLAPSGIPTHNDAYWTGGGNDVVITHNSLACTPEVNDVGGGCSADLFVGGDFATARNFTIDRNLFPYSPSASYCGDFGEWPGKPFPVAYNIHVTNNVFQRGASGKCGEYGPIDAWSGANGNTWVNNKWDDGATLIPS